MPILKNYDYFFGAHCETASVRHLLASLGVKSPHDHKPFSEAMLFGIGGGISVLHFVFEYKGFPPHFYLGTRLASPTDDLLKNIFARLGLTMKNQQAANPKQAAAQLVAALERGQPAMVWADTASLKYNALERNPFGGVALPVVVFGYDEKANAVHIADRARVPLKCTLKEFADARARAKNRLLTLAAPKKLPNLNAAILAGIRDSAAVMLRGPKRGPKPNFGLAALAKWADLLTNPKDKKGWANVFARADYFYAALQTTYAYIETTGAGGAARGLYADFLDEASDALNKPKLKVAAALYRNSAKQWRALAHAALPKSVAQFRETRELLERKHDLFLRRGNAALGEMQKISARMDALRAEIKKEPPLSDTQLTDLRENLREHILRVHAAESDAVRALNAVIK